MADDGGGAMPAEPGEEIFARRRHIAGIFPAGDGKERHAVFRRLNGLEKVVR